METLSKADFARRIGVSDSRVSQMIREGLIGPEALVGQGRKSRVIGELAAAHIAARRDMGQAVGNGLLTQVSDLTGFAGDSRPEPSPAKVADDVAAKIQLARLEGEERKNRLAARDEAMSNGQLVVGAEMQREIGKAAQAIVNVFTGMAPDIANAIAAKFELPQRDVLHLVRQVMNDRRGAAAKDVRATAEQLPDTVDAEIETA